MGNYSIKEIELILFKNNNNLLSEELLENLKRDERQGVQKLLHKWKRENEKQQQLKEDFNNMLQHEVQLRKKNIKLIAGIDEVGRGPLAGPVVASAVILSDDFCLLGLNDSKKLSKKKRDEFYEYIMEQAIAVGIGVVSAAEIDKVNIYEATKKAMHLAIEDLECVPEHLLIDAMKLQTLIPQTSLIKGDQKSVSIAASSIIAKVTRDRMMEELGRKHPQYGFEEHMGYGTSKHLDSIDMYGVIDEHRKSFSPIKEGLLKTEQINLF